MTACGSSKSLSGTGGQPATGGQPGTGGQSAGGGAGQAGRGAGGGGNAGGGQGGGKAGAGGAAAKACSDTSATQSNSSCRSVADCGPVGPIVCCTSGNCWPDACPIPPTMCGSDTGCRQNQDCDAGETCSISTTSTCPHCTHGTCLAASPPCTPSSNCGPGARCDADAGVCVLIPCTQGYTCRSDQRCAVGNPAADGYGCEPIPCDDGWTCPTNTRCTTPSTPVNHGCTLLTCKSDGDCDCGFCVNGTCLSNLGYCSSPPA
jgi:hypothetical protein